jgi:hypothetical protein
MAGGGGVSFFFKNYTRNAEKKRRLELHAASVFSSG